MNRPLLFLAALLSASSRAVAFAPPASSLGIRRSTPDDVSRVAPLHMSDSGLSPATKERIESLVENNPVLLFMKGSKLFPQCGFSNTACQILQSYGIDFESVDILADEEMRQGIKVFSQWPTIPQLYVCGEFIGGSDIMIEMYQSGELGEMIEKAKADMV
eukprot:CAMPEP_0172528782 /NCGR_PEP_ID=MMETSP1067-20121228/3051_1 /TAXON_ID=265564 ORGANISM="Thalassiosira punctigera, Strain Tpunct2005C2" /NCGR_SAMPLE_ID=MMETSP1067 /ASSEMBLY_ACC=CAM_ASM_000444 /LENGTH=159 /DNA_ID=CAMNT_0013312747 /DNA_START=109 /DNA_END=588 /DNA_ORIENTATION=+